MEENETLVEALKREFKEETNLDADIGEIIGTRIEKTFDRTKLIFVFKVRSGIAKLDLILRARIMGGSVICLKIQFLIYHLTSQT